MQRCCRLSNGRSLPRRHPRRAPILTDWFSFSEHAILLSGDGVLWDSDQRADLPQPNALTVSLIEINLRQFRFVVTFARVRAWYDGVPKCAITVSTTSNRGLRKLATS